jgi:hypothetical protein
VAVSNTRRSPRPQDQPTPGTSGRLPRGFGPPSRTVSPGQPTSTTAAPGVRIEERTAPPLGLSADAQR